MVCKEDILLWFKESASYKRIDVICNLLNMCVPFELRFVGTFVEEIGKHSYQELRGAELKANNSAEIASEVSISPAGLCDGAFRRKITLYLSLLHSYNHTCARGFYEILTSSEWSEAVAKSGVNASGDGNILEELLLLYTMALNHPAFTFEQHTCLGKILMKLLEQEKLLNPQPVPYSLTLQRRPEPAPRSYVLYNSPMREDAPGPVPMTATPPGIPLTQPFRDPTATPVSWAPPPNPPSPHMIHQESPVQSRTVSPVNPPTNMYSTRTQPTRRPPFQNRQEVPSRKTQVNCMEEKEQDSFCALTTSWRNLRNQNGIRTGRGPVPPVTCPQQHLYCTTQLENLSLEPEASRHCSSSSESGRSSTSHSPPGTPHAPPTHNRQPLRVNGRPDGTPISTAPPPIPPSPAPAPTQPPFPQQQNSVPYTTPPYTIPTSYPRLSYPTTAPPHAYRPPFTYQPGGELMYTYTPPFLPVMTYHSQAPPPKLTCYNCGSVGHTGQDCAEPSMEEITRQGNYQIDFASPDCSTDK